MLRSELSFYLNVNIWLVKSFIWGFHAISQKNPNKLFGQSNSLLGKIPGDSEGQGSLPCCSSWGLEESDTTWPLNNNSSLHAIKPLPRKVIIVIPAVTRSKVKRREEPILKDFCFLHLCPSPARTQRQVSQVALLPPSTLQSKDIQSMT